ncbi:MAG: hypothetical protein ACE5KE_06680, partial [Methanosarcinales archaeon]
PPNQPPTFSNLNQYKSDGVFPIAEGGTTTESIVVFKAILNDLDNDQAKLQIELRQILEPFTGIFDGGILESEFISSGNEATIIRTELVDGQYHWRARAIDSQGNASDWQEFGEEGNVDFEVKLVPLYTQVRSPYPSWMETERWFNKRYGTGDYGCIDIEYGYPTIRSCGCAITSMVMLGRYYNIDTAINSSNVDPGNINTWLTNKGGYTSDGRLWWGKGIEYLGFVENGEKKKRLSLDYWNAPFGSPTIDTYIDSAKPATTYSSYYGHYFVIDNKIKIGLGTYTTKDPYWYNTKTLNDNRDIPNYIQDYNNRFATANLFSYLTPPQKITSSIYLYLSSPAELLITDPLGRKLGKDPIADILYNEIPDGNYTKEGPIVTSDIPLEPGDVQESRVVYIPYPIDGEYDIKVIGTESGGYTTGLLVYDQNGQSKDITQEGNTTVNNIQEFELNYYSQIIEQTEVYRIVDIDIKPGSYPSSINLKSKGVTPVAVLTNDFFDVKDIVIDSVVFAGANPLRGKLEDVDNDNDLDLILHFSTQSLQLDPTDTESTLTGQLTDGALIKGTDSIRIVGK